jgi:hypothetical protein
MKTYLVTGTVTVTRAVEANSKDEAISKVDKNDMMHEIKSYSVSMEFEAEDLDE